VCIRVHLWLFSFYILKFCASRKEPDHWYGRFSQNQNLIGDSASRSEPRLGRRQRIGRVAGMEIRSTMAVRLESLTDPKANWTPGVRRRGPAKNGVSGRKGVYTAFQILYFLSRFCHSELFWR
jgi:hypothetical protein